MGGKLYRSSHKTVMKSGFRVFGTSGGMGPALTEGLEAAGTAGF